MVEGNDGMKVSYYHIRRRYDYGVINALFKPAPKSKWILQMYESLFRGPLEAAARASTRLQGKGWMTRQGNADTAGCWSAISFRCNTKAFRLQYGQGLYIALKGGKPSLLLCLMLMSCSLLHYHISSTFNR